MPSNAFDTMVVPVIRALFLTAILGGATVSLARMLRSIASSLRPPGEGTANVAEGPPQAAPEAARIPAEEGLATSGAR